MSQSKYKKEFCTKLPTLGKLGYSMAEIASEFGISRTTLYQWIEDPNKDEFNAAYVQYDTELEAYCQRLLRDVGEGKVPKANIAAIIYRIRTLLGQRHPVYLIDLKKEIKHESSTSPEQIKQELKHYLTNNIELLAYLLNPQEPVNGTIESKSDS